MSKTTHVVPVKSGGWNVKQGGGAKASRHFETKQPAIAWGRKVSRNKSSEFYIHGRDGRIQSKDSHGLDRYPPKG